MKKRILTLALVVISVFGLASFLVACDFDFYDYTVNFETFGGTPIDSQQVNNESPFVEPPDPVKEGFTFGGWYFDSKLTLEYRKPSDINQACTLYAKWLTDEVTESKNAKIAEINADFEAISLETYSFSIEAFAVKKNQIIGQLSYVETLEEVETLYTSYYLEKNKMPTNVEFVQELIAELPQADTQEKLEIIMQVRGYYAQLTTAQQNNVSNYNILQEAEDGFITEYINAVIEELTQLKDHLINNGYSQHTAEIVADFDQGIIDINAVEIDPSKFDDVIVDIIAIKDSTAEKMQGYSLDTIAVEFNFVHPTQSTIAVDVNHGSTLAQAIAKVTGYVEPSRDGYVFVGWEDVTLEITYTLESVIEQSVSLSEVWTPIAYTLNLELNGGSASATTYKIEYNSQISVAIKPTRQFYLFRGFFLDSEFTVPFTNEDGVVDQSIDWSLDIWENETIQLYAKWENSTYTISLRNQVTGQIQNIIQNHGEAFTFPNASAYGWSRTGYIFEGWSTSENGSLNHFEGGTYKNDNTAIVSVNFFTKWVAKKYAVIFDTNASDAVGDILAQTFTYDVKGTLFNNLTSKSFSRPNYVFQFWTTDPTDVNGVKDRYLNASSEILNLTTADSITLYAQWKEGSPELNYTLYSGSYRVSADSDKALTDIIIPDYYYGLPVVDIPTDAFRNYVGMQSIVLPATITSIGANAFNGCSSIAQIGIPSSVVSIGAGAFADCVNLQGIALSASVTSIGAGAFSNCTNLASITLPFVGGSITSTNVFAYNFDSSSNTARVPSSLKTVVILGGKDIVTNAFSNCIYIENIALPSSITSIGTNAFANCYNLASISIPATTATIGTGAFVNCRAMTTVTFEDNKITSIPANLFEGCLWLDNVTIPSTVTSIGINAFYNCIRLSSIEIPANVTTISSNAFGGCELLEAVTFTSNKITTISANLFDGCKSLKNILIPSAVTSIGANAFSGCVELETINIPSLVESIGANAFNGCFKLEDLNFDGISKLKTISEYAFANCGLTTLDLPESMTQSGSSIGKGAFYLCEIETATLPYIGGSSSSNNYIGYIFGASSFYENYVYSMYLKTVTIRSGTTVASNAFNGCISLESVVLPNSVTTIGESAFEGCQNLVLSLPSALRTIDKKAFYNCQNLISLQFPASLTSIGEHAFAVCVSLQIVEFSTSITSLTISSYAFYMCENISTLTLPSSLSSIGFGAFMNCDDLTSISLPFVGNSKSAYPYLGYIFGGETYAENGRVVPDGLKTVTITGNGSIGANAFYGCDNIEYISYSKDITSIGANAFANCTSLRRLNSNEDGKFVIENGITSIGSALFGGFANVSNMSKLVVPFVASSSSTSNPPNSFLGYMFGASTFNSNGNFVPASLKSVQITGSGSIGQNAFHGCIYIEQVIYSKDITSIGANAFANCTSLKILNVSPSGIFEAENGVFIISENITSIGDGAFKQCIKLARIYLFRTSSAGLTTISNTAFNDVQPKQIIVSKSSVSDYKANNNWKTFVDAGWSVGFYYEIKFVLNGGTGIEVVQTTSLDNDSQVPKRLHYDFNDWYVDDSFSDTFYNRFANAQDEIVPFSTSIIGNSGITLYAKWTPTNYRINYKLEFGEITLGSTVFTLLDREYLLSEGVKTHYDFMGWTTKIKVDGVESVVEVNTYGELLDYIADGKITARNSSGNIVPIPLTPHWVETTYSIYYDLEADETTSSFTEFTILNSGELLADASKTHYEFVEWYIETLTLGDEVVTSVDEILVLLAAHEIDFVDIDGNPNGIVIKARFNPISYQVTYDFEGGYTNVNSAWFTALDKDVEFAGPDLAHHYTVWTVVVDVNDVVVAGFGDLLDLIASGDLVVVDEFDVAVAIVVKGEVMPITYTIRYNFGGVEVVDDQLNPFAGGAGDMFDFDGVEASEVGVMTFDGWSVGNFSSAGGLVVTTWAQVISAIESDGSLVQVSDGVYEVVIYANWTAI